MNLAPLTTPQVLAFFGNHRWMAVFENARAETLRNASGWGQPEECRRMTAEWVAAAQKHETEAFDAVMRLHAPNGFTSFDDFFRDWTRIQLGRFLEVVEDRVMLQRFGFRIRSLPWPWSWKENLTLAELDPLLRELLVTLKMQVHPWEAEKWSAARLMAMSVYPDRFSELAKSSARTAGPGFASFSGLHFRPRGLTEKGEYKIWLVLEGRGGTAVLDLADDPSFVKKIRDLVKEATQRLTPTDTRYPLLVTLIEPSERQKQIVIEALSGISSDPVVRFRIYTPVTRRASDEKPLHILEWNGGRYVMSEETYPVP